MALTRAAEVTGTRARPRVDREAGTLVGSRCATCGACSWPGRAICSSCGGDEVEFGALPTSGQLLSYTTVWVPRPGLSAPYVLGHVDLGRGATIFAHVRGLPETTQVPLPVSVVLSRDPEGIPNFWFEPAI